jgi:hypothetical protein
VIVSPISITRPDDQSGDEGDSGSLTVSATGSGTLKYSALGLPSGLSINTTTGVITGTVGVGDSGQGWYYTTIIVSNGTSSASTWISWNIFSPVTLSLPGYQISTVGDTISLQLEGIGSGTLIYAANGLPTGLSLDSATGLITATISSSAASIGWFVTTITVSNGTYSAVERIGWNVSAAGAVTLATPNSQSDEESDSVSVSLSGSGSGTLKYFAIGLPSGLVINPSTGGISGTMAVNVAAVETYLVTAIVTNGSASAWQTIRWTLSSPLLLSAVADQSSTEGSSVSLSVSATYSGSGTLRYGAVGLPAGLSIHTGSGVISGTTAVNCAATDPYFVTVVVGDGTPSAMVNFIWTISNPITVTPLMGQNSTEGTSVTLAVGASGSGTLKYSAVGLPPGLSINSNTGVITGTVSVGSAENGFYWVTVTASDGTSSASQSFSWRITYPITITNPGTQDFSQGNVISYVITASTTTSGTLTFIAQNLPAGLSIN